MKPKFKIAHMMTAQMYAKLSYAERRKVGCVIVKDETMNRRRDSLHHTKVPEFLKWATSKGYAQQPVKGAYEMFRLHNPKKGEILIAHKRDKTDHITTTGRLTHLVGVWLKEKRDCAASPAVI